jgi:hypothetical protein
MFKDLVLYFAVIAMCGLVFLVLHVVAIRSRKGDRLLGTLCVTIGVSALAGVAMGWWLLGDEFSSAGARLVACIGAGLTFPGYAGLYGLMGPASVDRSVSAHIVKLIYLAPQHCLKEAELFSLYTHADMLEKRFRECLEAGIIERRGDELGVTRRGARIARFYIVLGNVLGMRLWYLDRYRDILERSRR